VHLPLRQVVVLLKRGNTAHRRCRSRPCRGSKRRSRKIPCPCARSAYSILGRVTGRLRRRVGGKAEPGGAGAGAAVTVVVASGVRVRAASALRDQTGPADAPGSSAAPGRLRSPHSISPSRYRRRGDWDSRSLPLIYAPSGKRRFDQLDPTGEHSPSQHGTSPSRHSCPQRWPAQGLAVMAV
jgi:hypothetical protein